MDGANSARPLHILVLADRDWTHPQTGGNGQNIWNQVSRWVAWGHRVTVVAGTYPGAASFEQFAPNIAIHRMGGRATVFPRAIWSVLRGVGRDADVVVEVINGITFLTPLWLRKPRVALVHHVHRELYVGEFGRRRGGFLAWVLETLPLRYLYRHTRFLTISRAARDDLVGVGIPRDHITVAYLGVDRGLYRRGTRAERPQLIYVGRLKAYKRIELVLDVLEAVPGACLDIVGDGDHREALEAEIARRGLRDRVVMHGHVSEERKVELYGRAWVSLTASSSEGWSLTVMEAALCGTPSGALAIGGLPESVVDGETGVLAHSAEELKRRVREVIERPELRERMGDAAERRAMTFNWERSARKFLDVVEEEAANGPTAVGAVLASSETARAAAVAAVTLANHAIGVVFACTVARMLGATDYGSLAALLSAFIILAIPGSALQVATARESTVGALGAGSGLRAWTRTLVAACAALLALGVAVRAPLAEVLGVQEEWAAGALLPTLGLWLLVSVQRGALQGLGDYRAAGWSILAEGTGRLGLGVLLVLLGAGVTGAFLAAPLSLLAVTIALAVVLRRHEALGAPAAPRRRLRHLLDDARVPVAGLTLLAVLSNVDVIVARHTVGGPDAGSYAAAALAAKTLVWIAIGVGLYLLPEATRLAAAGQDPRRVLQRAIVVVGALCALPLAAFVLAPATIMRLAFGSELTAASDQLRVLALAMALLAVACLAVHYMLALGRAAFLPVLGAVAIAEPLVLAGVDDLSGFAALVLAVQFVAAAGVLAVSLHRPRETAAA